MWVNLIARAIKRRHNKCTTVRARFSVYVGNLPNTRPACPSTRLRPCRHKIMHRSQDEAVICNMWLPVKTHARFRTWSQNFQISLTCPPASTSTTCAGDTGSATHGTSQDNSLGTFGGSKIVGNMSQHTSPARLICRVHWFLARVR